MSKAPTIHDVASALGMHKSTVSLALSGKGNISPETRMRVQAIAKQLGYEPSLLAQRLAAGNQNPAVCIFSGNLDVGLATEKILMIQRAMSVRSYDVPIYTCASTTGDADALQAAQIKQLCRQRPRAIICAGQMLLHSVFEELEQYQRSGGIVVGYDLPIPLACDQVIFDREDNAYQAARHLLERGHRKIGIGMSNAIPWRSEDSRDPRWFRLQGFRRALREFGAPAREDWFFQNALYEAGGAEMARRFVAMSDRPTGLCIVNDYVALAFMVEAMRMGVRIPEDVSVVGHDNQPISLYCPVPLTSVSQPAARIAEEVVAIVDERLNGSDAPPKTVILTGDLVMRDSVTGPVSG